MTSDIPAFHEGGYNVAPDEVIYHYGNWRTKAIFLWLLISTIYLAPFPRFVDHRPREEHPLTLYSLMDACSGTSMFIILNSYGLT